MTVAILAGFSSVILVMLLGQSRVFFAMSHDGLVPSVFSDVHPRYKTPYKSNLMFLVLHGALRRVHPRRHRRRDDEHRDALRVHAGVRRRLDHARRRPDVPRGFMVPLLPVVATLGIVVCGAMIYGLGWTNWLRLGVWLLIGLFIYFGYARSHSRLHKA